MSPRAGAHLRSCVARSRIGGRETPGPVRPRQLQEPDARRMVLDYSLDADGRQQSVFCLALRTPPARKDYAPMSTPDYSPPPVPPQTKETT